jgi:hypothetical protein
MNGKLYGIGMNEGTSMLLDINNTTKELPTSNHATFTGNATTLEPLKSLCEQALIIHPLKVRNETWLVLQLALHNTFVAAHQQPRKLDRPVPQIAVRKWAHLRFDALVHVLVVVLLITECSE